MGWRIFGILLVLAHAEERGLNRQHISPSFVRQSNAVKVAFIDADRALERMDETHTTIPSQLVERVQELNSKGYFVSLISRNKWVNRKALDTQLFNLQRALSKENAAVHYIDFLEHSETEDMLGMRLDRLLGERFLDDGGAFLDKRNSVVYGEEDFRHFADQYGVGFNSARIFFSWPVSCRTLARQAAIRK